MFKYYSAVILHLKHGENKLMDVRNGNIIGAGEISRGVTRLERLVPEGFAIRIIRTERIFLPNLGGINDNLCLRRKL